MKIKLIGIVIFSLIVGSLNNAPLARASEDTSKTVPRGKNIIAIVIDDLGNRMDGTDQIIDMDIPLTVAVMPFLETTTDDANRAYQAGHEVIVHMPMEPRKGKKSWLGPGSLMSNFTDEEVRKRVEAAIDNVPHAVGMNNHMGSKITSDERIMRIVLTVCKERGLYFLDSKTNDKSIVSKLAMELQVPYAENVLFLDDVLTHEAISKQMNKAMNLLQQRTSTVIIGHVGVGGKKTAAVIEQSIPQLQQLGKIVFVSELINQGLIDPEVI